MDFSRIVEVFDANGASFVSVTQQFNTTTSMGRLTLNVLLSFAQFEREVTAERIRDKIAVSKKKGMWMGGVVPLGYRVENRKLLVNDAEAATVRWLFEQYLELRSERALVDEAKAKGYSGRASRRLDGSISTTHPFGRGNLYHLLSNPIYIGKIRHRDDVHEGEHEPIVDADTFAAAQQLLKEQSPRRRQSTNGKDVHLLTGILFDEAGDKLRSVHANKKGVRYRYYVSKGLAEARKKDDRGWRLPASEIEAIVEHQLNRLLHDRPQLTDWLQEFAPNADLAGAFAKAEAWWQAFETNDTLERRHLLAGIVRRVDLKPGEMQIEVDRHAIVVAATGDSVRHATDDADLTVNIRCPMSLRRRGVEMRMVVETDHAPARAPIHT